MKKYLTYLAPLILFVAFVVDAHLSTLLTNFAPGTIFISSHLLLIVAIYVVEYLKLPYSIILFTSLGIIYDVYYFGVLGISTTLLPLIAYLIYYFSIHIHLNRWTNLMMLVVMVFGFEFAGFILARLFQLTNLSMFIFVFYNAMPSLLFNVLFLITFQPILERIFQITDKT